MYIYIYNMKKILFIDSGLGGASIIKNLYQMDKKYDIVFYVENKFAPLGKKSKSFLYKLAKNIILDMQSKYEIGLVVLACNTLTVACIEKLRKELDIEIIGTEPNVKVGEGNTLVLATTFTIKHCKIIKNKPFKKISLPKLSKIIDKNFDNLQECLPYLSKKLKGCNNVSNVICGCTHYVFVKPYIKLLLGDVVFYDSVNGVSNRVVELASNFEKEKNTFELILSKKDTKLSHYITTYLFKN